MNGSTSSSADVGTGIGGYEHLLVTQDGGVLVITLNRPQVLNAISWQTWDEIESALDGAVADDAVRAVVFTGAGRGFSAGTDLTRADDTLASNRTQVTRARYAPILTVAGCRKPTIAAINGVVAGAGLSLALACDVRFAAETAMFHPLWCKRGLVPDLGATALLPDLIGSSRALELFYTGDGVGAARAETLGMVNRVLPPADLMPETLAYAQCVAHGPTVALELAKSLVNHRRLTALGEQIQLEEARQAICRGTDDVAEGFRSFREKREPVFTGR